MQGGRIAREKITMEKMILLYCQAKHQTDGALCGDCQRLADYAGQRLSHCLFGAQKPVCAKCPVHCYRPVMRAQIIEVMRFAGPRMLFKHPQLAVLHLLDSWQSRPSNKNRSNR